MLGIIGAMLSGIAMANRHGCGRTEIHDGLRLAQGGGRRVRRDRHRQRARGLTGANRLAKAGRRVLLLEHHYQFGGLATWFTRKGGHIFDISLHGFPEGMVKSCRKYWTREIADMIMPLRDVRFVNPQFDVRTTFTRDDYTRVLVERFGLERARVEAFFGHLAGMNFYDRSEETIGAMFERFFPGRDDVHRLLLEPIAYANGSALDDPSVAYAIVFGNFMGGGIHTFRGGSDLLIGKMVEELRRNGAELRKHVLVERILVEERGGRKVAAGVVARGGRVIRSRAVLANSSLKNTLFRLAGEENLPPDYAAAARAVRVNSSSCQVYLGIRKGESHPAGGGLDLRLGEPRFGTENSRISARPAAPSRCTIRKPARARTATRSSPRSTPAMSDWHGSLPRRTTRRRRPG